MTTTATVNKAPRAYMGTTSKHLVVLAEAERDAAKLTNMLTYASEKYAHVKENHPTRAKRWERAMNQISQILSARSSGIPAATFVQKPVAKRAPAKKAAAPAKAGSHEARIAALEGGIAEILKLLKA